jgi:hypothetical protein
MSSEKVVSDFGVGVRNVSVLRESFIHKTWSLKPNEGRVCAAQRIPDIPRFRAHGYVRLGEAKRRVVKVIAVQSSGNCEGFIPKSTMLQPAMTFSPSLWASTSNSGDSAPGLSHTSPGVFAAMSGSTVNPTAGGR